MKTAIKLLAVGLMAMSFTDAHANSRREHCRYIEYWERVSYREGFNDGYQGYKPRNYFFELDDIAYQIGYIDGLDAFDNETRNCNKRFRF